MQEGITAYQFTVIQYHIPSKELTQHAVLNANEINTQRGRLLCYREKMKQATSSNYETVAHRSKGKANTQHYFSANQYICKFSTLSTNFRMQFSKAEKKHLSQDARSNSRHTTDQILIGVQASN